MLFPKLKKGSQTSIAVQWSTVLPDYGLCHSMEDVRQNRQKRQKGRGREWVPVVGGFLTTGKLCRRLSLVLALEVGGWRLVRGSQIFCAT